MPGFEELHVAPAAAEALSAMGWDIADPAARELAPTAARGHNLVAVTPPAPAYAAPALAGVLGRVGQGVQLLLLAPEAEADSWGALVHRLSRGLGLRVQVAHGEARALRRLRAGELDVLVTSPDTALSLLRRSALRTEAVGAIVLAWPERLEDGSTLTELMHDLPRESQRIIVTALPERAGDFVERYARKALTVGGAGGEGADPTAAGAVRTASVPWERRPQALAQLLELLDPASAVIWAADRSAEAEIARSIPLGEGTLQLATGDAPAADLIIAYDLPSTARLSQLREAGSVVLLVPPGTEGYVARIAARTIPVRLPGLTESVTTEAAQRRARIAEAIGGAGYERAILTLAPLFERHDPASVAAALYELWRSAASGAASPGAAPVSTGDSAAGTGPASATGKIWAGIGRNDGVTAADFVGTMTKELRVDRAQIGRIELKDSFSLIEVPSADVERIAQALNGVTIRRKRVIARADRGQTRDRPTARDRSGPRTPPTGGRPPRRPA
ncbi:MAG TPA: DbpA RNA binding domain-containing protein [Gemmatimonadales bacterium]|nr:DbpA RNA binding domain-containing protein [Gemmatimonadales bacterium]